MTNLDEQRAQEAVRLFDAEGKAHDGGSQKSHVADVLDAYVRTLNSSVGSLRLGHVEGMKRLAVAVVASNCGIDQSEIIEAMADVIMTKCASSCLERMADEKEFQNDLDDMLDAIEICKRGDEISAGVIREAMKLTPHSSPARNALSHLEDIYLGKGVSPSDAGYHLARATLAASRTSRAHGVTADLITENIERIINRLDMLGLPGTKYLYLTETAPAMAM
mgnify:CR=1 FL=1